MTHLQGTAAKLGRVSRGTDPHLGVLIWPGYKHQEPRKPESGLDFCSPLCIFSLCCLVINMTAGRWAGYQDNSRKADSSPLLPLHTHL